MNIMIEPEIENYRPEAYLGLMAACKEINAKVHFYRVRKKLKKRRHKYLKFPVFNEQVVKSMDALIVYSPYATRQQARKFCSKYKTPLLHLENGFLPSSALCDIGGFWGDSDLFKGIDLDPYSNEKCYKWAREYSNYLISNNLSKNRQPAEHTRIKNDFVFLPMQYMNDQSVLRFGNMPYPRFMRLVSSFCYNNGLTLAVKKHPKAFAKEPKAVNSMIKNLQKRFPKTVKVVDGSIHWFCQNCQFMAGMNTGSICDGLINNCVTSHCGKSIYMNTGAVVHDNDVLRGLESCLRISDESRNVMFNKQRALLYYLYNHYLLLEKDVHGSELNNKSKVINQLRKI